ncbi:MAG: tetratricopeptide repeat protein [Flavobacteriaceae bacterium]
MVTPNYETPWGDKIGLSWYLQSYLDRPIMMHTGSDTGFESLFYVYPEERITITVLANRDFARTGRIINAVSEVLFNETPKEYNISAKYKFTEAYKTEGLEKAKYLWNEMKKDTTDAYFTEDEDVLTTGAVLENGKKWSDAKAILAYYLTLNEKSTYAWRLLGNANLNLGDTTEAIRCYEQTLTINPDYEKGKEALEALLKGVK